MPHRTVCGILCVALLAGAFSSCKRDEPEVEETPAGTELGGVGAEAPMTTDIGTDQGPDTGTDPGTGLATTEMEPSSEEAYSGGGLGMQAAAPPPTGQCAAGPEALVAVPGTEFGPIQPDCDITEPQYTTMLIEQPRPELCQQECLKDPKCKAFAYTPPGTYGMPKAACWLKSRAGTFINHAKAAAAVRVGR